MKWEGGEGGGAQRAFEATETKSGKETDLLLCFELVTKSMTRAE